MKETTRYAVLLFAVLTFITSSYIAINALSTDNVNEQTDTPSEIDEMPQELNETGDGLNDTSNNTSETEKTSGEPDTQEEEADGIIGKSVNGFKLLFNDIGEGLKILSD